MCCLNIRNKNTFVKCIIRFDKGGRELVSTYAEEPEESSTAIFQSDTPFTEGGLGDSQGRRTVHVLCHGAAMTPELQRSFMQAVPL